MTINKFIYGAKSYSYCIEYKDRKTLGIRVHPDLTINVLAPLDSEIKSIEEKVISKARWIYKQINHFEKYLPHTTERKYLNGESHLYLGRQYRLNIIHSNENNVVLKSGKIIVYTTQLNTEYVKSLIQEWYKQKALQQFSSLFEECKITFSKKIIKEARFHIRTMPKKWGSCSAKGLITLNPELIKAPKACIEFVIIHELCHIIHYNHKKAFYQLLSNKLPDWEKWKEKLESLLA